MVYILFTHVENMKVLISYYTEGLSSAILISHSESVGQSSYLMVNFEFSLSLTSALQFFSDAVNFNLISNFFFFFSSLKFFYHVLILL